MAVLLETTSGPGDGFSNESFPQIFVDQPTASLAHKSLKPVYDNRLANLIEVAHAAKLHCSSEQLLQAEVDRGKAYFDSRVDSYQAQAFHNFSRTAQREFFNDVHVGRNRIVPDVLLAATARTVDYSLDPSALAILVREVMAKGHAERFLDLVQNGVPARSPFEDPAELMAAVVRWVAENHDEKYRIRASAEIREWMKETLDRASVNLHPRLGGVSAVNTLQGEAFGDRTTMMSLGSMPAEIEHYLGCTTPIVGDVKEWDELQDIPVEGHSAGHFCFLGKGVSSLLPEEFSHICVNGRIVGREEFKKLDVLVTGSSTVIGFGTLSNERLREIGHIYDLVVLTGLQNLSDSNSITTYLSQLKIVHDGGANIGICFVEPKHKDVEMELWARLRESKSVEFFGLNTGEAHQLLTRIYAAGENSALRASPDLLSRISEALAIAEAPNTVWSEGNESPQWVFRATTLLQEALGIPLLRVRAKACDVLVVDKTVDLSDPEGLRNNMILSRHLGAVKVATEAGLIVNKEKLAFLKNPPPGNSLAALFQIGDEAALTIGPAKASADIPWTGYSRLADGRYCFAIPPVGFYKFDGGTVSAGDTIDYSLMSREVWHAMSDARKSHRVRVPQT